jgi:hypothetical protein
MTSLNSRDGVSHGGIAVPGEVRRADAHDRAASFGSHREA